MSSTNWDTYVNKVLKDIIIDDHFNENDTVKCSYKKCTTMFTIEECYPYQYQTTKGKEKLKPVCKKCYDIINL
jgi:hypothetical protein